MGRPTSRVSRVVVSGPLAPFAEVYKRELSRRRYTPLTVVNHLRQVARLSRWLEANGLGVAELSGERVDEFLALQRVNRGQQGQLSRPGLLCLLDVLRQLGAVAAVEPAREARPRRC